MSSPVVERLLHPSQVIERAQARLEHFNVQQNTSCLNDHSEVSSHLDAVLADARKELLRYFSHRPSDRVPSVLDRDPLRVAGEIAQITLDILVGVMARAAIFEALERELRGIAPLPGIGAYESVDYCTTNVHRYLDADGEHQFMQSLSGRLDDGLHRYYRRSYSVAYRSRLREAIVELKRTEGELGESRPDLEFTGDGRIDPWIADPDTMFANDRANVQDQIRRLLRHNAETVMLFTRILPEVVFDGFVNAGVDSPTMTLVQLQRSFVTAIPTILLAAGARLKRGTVITPETRQRAPLHSDELQCFVEEGVVTSFRWPIRRLQRPGGGGRCPASSLLPALSPQEADAMSLTAQHDEAFESMKPTTYAYMSTAEALLRLAVFVAPEMWLHQFEAHRICPELATSPLKTMRDVALSSTA